MRNSHIKPQTKSPKSLRLAALLQAGRDQRKKDLGAMAMAYQHVYAPALH